MDNDVTLEIPESELGEFEATLDKALAVLRHIDEEHEQRQPLLARLRDETRALINQIRAELNVEKIP